MHNISHINLGKTLPANVGNFTVALGNSCREGGGVGSSLYVYGRVWMKVIVI